jgi:hypothetical protein
MLVTIVGLAVSAALVIPLVGLVCFRATFAVTGMAARLERARARRLLAVDSPEPAPFATRRRTAGRLRARLRDRQTWSEIVYLLVAGPAGCASALVVVFVCYVIAQAVGYPFSATKVGYTDNAWGGPSYLGATAVHSGAGVVALFLGPWLVKLVTGGQGRLVQRLLGPRERAEGCRPKRPCPD